jgi:hypothetical protein
MAIGDTRWFVDYWHYVLDNGGCNFGATPNTIKCALIKSLANGGVTPTTTTTNPTWGGTGTDMSAYEVAAGGEYVTGGTICASPATTVLSNTISLTWSNPAAWTQNAANPTNARWGIFWDTTTLRCLAWYDLGADRDLTAGELLITMYNPVLDIVVPS